MGKINKLSKEISWIQAMSWIVGSLLISSILFNKLIRFGFEQKRVKASLEKIEYIVQTGSSKEALYSDYFMESLNLSIDRPVFFADFDPKWAEQRLSQAPIIQDVHVKKIKPNIVYVDYQLRKPYALVGDFFNAAIDRQGVLFPIRPFFSPKRLPELYLGDTVKDLVLGPFGKRVQGKYIDLATSLLDQLEEEGKELFSVKKIDVSLAFSSNLGEREIVVVLENEHYFAGEKEPAISLHFLRLSLKGHSEEIANYLKLRAHLLEVEKEELAVLGSSNLKERTIDLRLPQMAFVK